jgi:uncharacterized protein (DUF305 family)
MPSSRIARWVLGVLSVAVLIGVGFLAGTITTKLNHPGNNSAEAGFARDMSTHHAQAVAMAMDEVQNGTDPNVVRLASDIAVTQQGQIGEMQTWLDTWHLLPTGDQPKMAWMPDGPVKLVNGLMPGMASTDEMNKLSTLTGKASDILFCQLMLRHHLGGIHMVEGILQVSHDSQVRTLATAMLNGQQGEVVILQGMLQTFGVQPLTS